MAHGFAYLITIIDCHSRFVLSWRLSNTMDTNFCLEAQDEALERFRRPEVFNSDQGSQFTSDPFTCHLREKGIAISMDGRGRCIDNVFVERLWRSLEYEDVFLHVYDDMREARTGIDGYWDRFNRSRQRQSLGYQAPVFHCRGQFHMAA